jgi:hypothetical protein
MATETARQGCAGHCHSERSEVDMIDKVGATDKVPRGFPELRHSPSRPTSMITWERLSERSGRGISVGAGTSLDSRRVCMGGIILRAGRRRVSPRFGNPSRLRPELSPLEDRVLQAIISVKLTATPQILPNNGRYVPVRLVGEVSTTNPKDVPVVLLQVIDQYRMVEPSGQIKLRPTENAGTWSYDLTIKLQGSRSNTFKDSRLYSVTVGAEDTDNGGGKTVPVIVPNPASTPKGPRFAGARRPGGQVRR